MQDEPALLFCSLLLVLKLSAQDSLRQLDPVTITATIQPSATSTTGRNILSIGGSHFAALPIHSVDELLRYLPGVEVQMRGPMGAQSDIVLRGGTFQQVLVLLDGMRINDPNTGHFNAYIPITPPEIERVEILKGASSALYGSDAVGGVIQVITRTFAARGSADKINLQASGGAGEYDLYNVNAGGSYQHGTTALSGGILSNNTSGQPQRGTDGFVHANTVGLSGSAWLGRNLQVALRAAYDDRRFAAQNFYTSFASDTARERIRSVWTQGRIVYDGLAHHLITADVSYKQLRDDYAFSPLSAANKSISRLSQALVRDQWTINSGSSLVSGVQLQSRQIASNDRGDHTLGQVGMFVLLIQSIGSHLNINPSLRLDHNKRSGTELIPQLSVAWHAGELVLRGSAGKTIRDADFTERFNNYNKMLVTSGRVGNPDLQAERSVSYEVGADWTGVPGLKISATAFRRDHRRLIDYVVTPYADMPRKDNLKPGAVYALARNIARVHTNGVELDLSYSRQLSTAASLMAGAGAVWLESRSSDSIPSFYLSSHARWMCNCFIEFHLKRLNLGVTGIYKTRPAQAISAISAKQSTSYFTGDVKLGYELMRRRMDAFVLINNVLDRHYSDLVGAVMPGRWVSGGLRVRFIRD